MKKGILIFLICILLGACGDTSQDHDATKKITLTVSAAASLKNALSEIENDYEATHHNIDIKFNYGSSGALAQQIISGAPVDIFFSAAQDKVDFLVKEKAVDAAATKTVLKNHLVLISKDKLQSTDELKADHIKKIAIGNPELVPAGKYGKQALEKLGLYEAIQPKLILTKDVRQVLTYVETGNTEAGIVYASDLKATSKIDNKIAINKSTHEPITYPIALIKATKHNEAATNLYEYLQSEASMKVYEKYGFNNKK